MDQTMRIDKFLADMGYGTRSEVKKLIKNGWVSVNDQQIKKTDLQIKENDIVKVDDTIVSYVDFEYYILNKPAGTISATEDDRYPTVLDIIESKRHDLFPVGRLDLDTEGLLLITNDGKLAHKLLSPKHHVKKTYYVEFNGQLPSHAEDVFQSPMDLGDFITLPATLEIINTTSAYLTIEEGKFHQVKRMFEHVGCFVTYLKRIKFGLLSLNDLEIGQYRELTPEELEQLTQA